MKLHPDKPSPHLVVTAYETGLIAVNGRALTRSLLLTPHHLDGDWGPDEFAALALRHVEPLAALSCDVLLLGTGNRQRFPSPALMRPLIEAGCGYEVMDTAAACRTYNILVAEGRAVAAALILEPPT